MAKLCWGVRACVQVWVCRCVHSMKAIDTRGHRRGQDHRQDGAWDMGHGPMGHTGWRGRALATARLLPSALPIARPAGSRHSRRTPMDGRVAGVFLQLYFTSVLSILIVLLLAFYGFCGSPCTSTFSPPYCRGPKTVVPLYPFSFPTQKDLQLHKDLACSGHRCPPNAPPVKAVCDIIILQM